MRLAKIVVVILLINIFQFFVSSCCEPAFYYSFDGIFLQVLKNGEIASDQTINQSEFGLKVNLSSQKYTTKTAGLAHNALAFDCERGPLEHDSITGIYVKMIDSELNTMTDITDNFIISSDSGDLYSSLDDLNMKMAYDFLNYIYLVPDGEISIKGVSRFIVEFDMYNKPDLSDTTNVIEII